MRNSQKGAEYPDWLRRDLEKGDTGLLVSKLHTVDWENIIPEEVVEAVKQRIRDGAYGTADYTTSLAQMIELGLFKPEESEKIVESFVQFLAQSLKEVGLGHVISNALAEQDDDE